MIKLSSLIVAGFLAVRLTSLFAQDGVSINVAPPVLPVAEQPPCPVEGYIWTPGYWAYGTQGYYWVPGVWVPPPQIGLLWTPPWWQFSNGAYVFHEGYWGPTVGFYGGINYGHGYFGHGYWGGRWEGNVFRYNTAVTHVNTAAVEKTFADESVLNKEMNRSGASFHGLNGVNAEPTAEEKAAEEHRKVPPTSEQLAQRETASNNRNLQGGVNKPEERGKTQELGPAAGAGKTENKPGNLSKPQSQGGGSVEKQGNKPAAASQRDSSNLRGNQAEARSGKAGSKKVTQKSRPTAKAGGKRTDTSGQQQRKKKSGKAKPTPRPR